MFSVLYLVNKVRPTSSIRVYSRVSLGLRGVRRVITTSYLLVALSLC